MDPSAQRVQLGTLHRESFGWALHCCGYDRQEAEEVLQMAYLKVLNGQAHFRGSDSQFKTWLFGVIRLTAASERRRHFLRHLWLKGYRLQAQGRPAVESPAAALRRAETGALLREALSRLPRRQRQVLHLAFYHDLSLSEIAAVLGISIGSARVHYERGKQSLRKRFYETGIFDRNEPRERTIESALP
jgi:RNA polymerase sigma factor (sigma-70 family)